MPGTISRTAMEERDILWIRVFHMLTWILVIGGLPWVAWFYSWQPFSILIPIVFSIVSVPIGWFFGYKRLIGPMGQVFIKKP